MRACLKSGLKRTAYTLNVCVVCSVIYTEIVVHGDSIQLTLDFSGFGFMYNGIYIWYPIPIPFHLLRCHQLHLN